MSDLTLPTWSFRPDWSSGILEALEWSTSINQSPSGAEQRRPLRLSPRRSMETSYVAIGNERTRFAAAMEAGGASKWNVPLPWDVNPLTADAPIGTQTVAVSDTTTSEFTVGSLVYFRGPDSFTYEVRRIMNMSPTSLTLDQGVTQKWERGTKLFPVREALLLAQPQLVRKADNAAIYSTTLTIAEPSDYPEAPWLDTYAGYPVFRLRPDESSDLTTEYSRLLSVLDSGFSIPEQQDTAGYQLFSSGHSFFIHGRPKHAAFRGLLYAMRGRVTPFWLPSFSQDLKLAKPIEPGDTTFTVKRSGLADFFVTLPNTRRDIILDPRNSGSAAVYRRVTEVQFDDATGDEVLTVDEPFTQNVYPYDLKRISFMSIARLNVDRIEIQHETDTQGVSTSSVTFQSTSEQRVATQYTYNRYPNNVKTADPCLCGSTCGSYGDSRTNGRDPVDSRSGKYPKTEQNNIDAMTDLLRAHGVSESDISGAVSNVNSVMDQTNSWTREYTLSAIQPLLTSTEYAQYAAMDDTTLHIAVRVLIAYNYYNLYFSQYTQGQTWTFALGLADTIDTCAQDDSDSTHTLLATACLGTFGTMTPTSQSLVNTDGVGYTVVFDPPYYMGFVGSDAGMSSNVYQMLADYTSWPEAIPPRMSSSEANSLVDLTMSFGGSLSGTSYDADKYIQPGCGAVPVLIVENKYNALHGPGASAYPPNTEVPADTWIETSVWMNFFTAAFVSRVPWPSMVRIRIRNAAGITIKDFACPSFSKQVDGTDVYLCVARVWPYLGYRTNTGSNGYYKNPAASTWYVLDGAGGPVVIDILTATSSDPVMADNVVNQDLS